MAARWRILIVVALAIAISDQWTKYLAVRHLTPGIERAHLADLGLENAPAAERKAAIESLSFFRGLTYFYGSVKKPCDETIAYCPQIRVIPGFWNWKYVENPGAAWGLFSGLNDSLRVPFFFAVSIGALLFIGWFFKKLRDDQRLLIWSLSLVFGGAIGNFIDRLHLSYVIDFVDWYIGRHHWPTFNLADAAITAGVVLLIVDMFVSRETAKEGAPGGASASEKSNG